MHGSSTIRPVLNALGEVHKAVPVPTRSIARNNTLVILLEEYERMARDVTESFVQRTGSNGYLAQSRRCGATKTWEKVIAASE